MLSCMKAFLRLSFYDISINFSQVHILANIKKLCSGYRKTTKNLERINIAVTANENIFQYWKMHLIAYDMKSSLNLLTDQYKSWRNYLVLEHLYNNFWIKNLFRNVIKILSCANSITYKLFMFMNHYTFCIGCNDKFKNKHRLIHKPLKKAPVKVILR